MYLNDNRTSHVCKTARENMGTGFITMSAGYHCRNLMFLVMLMHIIFAFLLGAQAVDGWKTLTEEENLEMERQLKIINKTPIKSFVTEHGDILDCIDIYKQHAFDHPLLKDHKVKMRPRRMPKETSTKAPTLLPKNIRCPPGSVLVKRTTKEDLIMANKMKALGSHYPISSGFRNTSGLMSQVTFSSAAVEYPKANFGAKTTINVWNPSVSSNQLSLASLWIANGTVEKVYVVQAGWKVYTSLREDNYTRLFTYWTADGYKKTGCYDQLCPGFVQVSPKTTPGLVLNQISTYNGTQKDIEVWLYQEGEWWLNYNSEVVGYWPQKLFSYMFSGADSVVWGGQVATPPNEPYPEMGSGHSPKEGLDGISAYIKQTQIWDGEAFVYPDPYSLRVTFDNLHCYDAQAAIGSTAPFPVDLFYGGPGHCSL